MFCALVHCPCTVILTVHKGFKALQSDVHCSCALVHCDSGVGPESRSRTHIPCHNVSKMCVCVCVHYPSHDSAQVHKCTKPILLRVRTP